MCRVALDGGTGGDSSGGSEEESGSDEHRRGGGSPVPVDEQELDEEDAGAPSAAAEGAVNPQVARLRAVLEDPTANPRCLFGEAGWAVLRLWQTRTVIASTAGRSAASGRATPAVHLPHAHAVPVPHAAHSARRELARAGQGDALCGAHLLGQDYREGAVLLPDGDAELPAPPRRAAQARELPRDRAPPRAQEARVRRGTLPSRRSDSITAKTLADSRARGHAEAFSEPSLNLLGAFPREPSREGRPRRC